MIKFPTTPVTLELRFNDGRPDVLRIASEVEWVTPSDSNPPQVLLFTAREEQRLLPLEQLEVVTHEMWKGVSGSLMVTVRPTQESDAVSSETMGGAPRIPMPIPTIRYFHKFAEGVNVPKLFALSEDDGFVATMMLSADDGIYVRYSGSWHELLDEDVVDGLNVTEVADSALDLFDQFDAAGQLVSVTVMSAPSGQRVEPLGPVTEDAGGAPEPSPAMQASGDVKDVPALNTVEDIEDAIAAAASDPTLQWWVERRAKALGLGDVEFPWH